MVSKFQYTADIVAFRRGRNEVLLIERGWPPFKGHRALPGGFVDAGENVATAAVREAREETGVMLGETDLEFVGTYGKPGRDPRGLVESTAFAVVVPSNTTVRAGDDAAEASWVGLDEAMKTPMAFDHRTILADAVKTLRSKKVLR